MSTCFGVAYLHYEPRFTLWLVVAKVPAVSQHQIALSAIDWTTP